jgi:WD40-like Beta Propeller Repeat
MSRQFLLVAIVRLFIVALLCLSSGAAIGRAQAADTEKIRDISPDGQFAVRGVDLVAVPSKKVLTNLGDDLTAMGDIIWSPDSKWFAFHYSGGPRYGDTQIYHRVSDEFVLVEEDFHADVSEEDFKGADTWAEDERPIRWIKPGVLVLEHSFTFRSGAEATFRLTAGVDPKSGKFVILSKKKIRSKTESN